MNVQMLNHHFMVDFGGSRRDFIDVAGLSFYRHPIESQNGASPERLPQKAPGPAFFRNVTLRRRAKKEDLELYEWWRLCDDPAGPAVALRDVTISLLDQAHQPVWVWRLINAYPVCVSFSPLSSLVPEPMTEEIELAFEKMFLQIA